MVDCLANKQKQRAQRLIASMIGAAIWMIAGPWMVLSGIEATVAAAEIADVGALTSEGVADGESVSEGEIDLRTDDVAYLTHLRLIRGHLAVGHALYQQGLPVLAETHMKHPREEIYSSVVPAFEARACPGFGEELTDLTRAVASRAPSEKVEEVYGVLIGAIDACEESADISNPIVISKVVENLLRTAGIEYQIGVVNGTMSNLHEYQDAWGFTQEAGRLAQSSAYSTSSTATTVARRLQEVIANLDTLWPSLDPKDVSGRDAQNLFDAAEQVQITALPLNR